MDKRKYELNELLAGVTDENKHPSCDDKPVGREVVPGPKVTMDDLLTDEVYQVALRHAEKYTTRMGIEPAELVHEGVRVIMARYEGCYGLIQSLGSLLSLEIYSRYINWLIWDRENERGTRSLTEYEAPGVGEEGWARPIPPAMWVSPGTDRMILQHDVETAISKLSPADQDLVRGYMAADFVSDELARRRGARHVETTRKQVIRMLKRLKPHLADYAPVGHNGKRSPSKSASRLSRTAGK